MLKQNQRISTNRASYILKKGLKFNNTYLSARFVLNKQNINRYGIVVSKKTLALATSRNTLRRQIYEILRLSSTQTTTGLDILFTIKPPLSTLSFQQKQSILAAVITEINNQISLNHLHGQ